MARTVPARVLQNTKGRTHLRERGRKTKSVRPRMLKFNLKQFCLQIGHMINYSVLTRLGRAGCENICSFFELENRRVHQCGSRQKLIM